MSQEQRRQVLENLGLVHPRAGAVSAALFVGGDRFFLVEDKLQVKYEMLRAHVVDGWSVTAAAEGHGYSRASFYVASAAFEAGGMTGSSTSGRADGAAEADRRRRRLCAGADAALSGAEVARQVRARFGVVLHRRTVERAEAAVSRCGRWRAGPGRLRRLRAAVLAGAPLASPRRPASPRRALGLMRRPAAEPVFVARLLGAGRRAWTPCRPPPGGAGRRLRVVLEPHAAARREEQDHEVGDVRPGVH